MSQIGPRRKFGLLQLTVIEYFSDMDIIHVHCKLQMNLENLAHPRLLVKHLIANYPVLRHKAHRLYYVVQPFCTIISLDDSIVSIEVFLEWFHRNVCNVYAVIVDPTTPSEPKKVSWYYVKRCHHWHVVPVDCCYCYSGKTEFLIFLRLPKCEIFNIWE